MDHMRDLQRKVEELAAMYGEAEERHARLRRTFVESVRALETRAQEQAEQEMARLLCKD